MSCVEKFIEFAERLLYKNNEEENVYTEMIELFEGAGLYQEQAGLVEKLFNVTLKPELYIQIGDIMREKLKNWQVAKVAYNKYLHLTQPQFYDKYIEVTDSQFKLEDESSVDKGLLNLTDKFSAIIYMMVYFHQRQRYSDILSFIKYLNEIERQIQCYINENSPRDISVLGDINNSKTHLAKLLAQVSNHNDINNFALKLDPTNEAPYLNIIDDYVMYDNFDRALQFYNDVYCPAFPDNSYLDNPVGLCWFLSDKYSAIGEFYNSICRQKKAIDLELCGA